MGRYFHEPFNEPKNIKRSLEAKVMTPRVFLNTCLGPKTSFEPNFSPNPFSPENSSLYSLFLNSKYFTLQSPTYFTSSFSSKKKDTFSLLSFSGEITATLSCQTLSLDSR